MKAKKFINVVENSRALHAEEKRDLAAVDDLLPKEYKEKVTELLTTFDEHSLARQKYLKEKLEEAYAKLEEELKRDGVGEETKNEVLRRAKEQIEKFL